MVECGNLDVRLLALGYDNVNRYVLSLDRKVDLDKRLAPAESTLLGKRNSAGKEFHILGAE